MRNSTSRLLYFSKNLIFILALSSSLAFSAERTVSMVDIGHAQLNIEAWKSDAKDFETIIVLPGSGADVNRYKYIAPLLADAGYQVVAVNQRGIAGSTGKLDGLSLHDYAADVAAIIYGLGSRKAHLLGWAAGNRTSHVVATDFPNKVASISLIAAGGLVKALSEPGELGRLLGEADIPEAEKVQLARRTLFSPAASDDLVHDYVGALKYWPGAQISQGQANKNTPLEH